MTMLMTMLMTMMMTMTSGCMDHHHQQDIWGRGALLAQLRQISIYIRRQRIQTNVLGNVSNLKDLN